MARESPASDRMTSVREPGGTAKPTTVPRQAMPRAGRTGENGDAPKLHVALVYEVWPPAEFGGIVRYLMCLADGLRDRGHSVTVVTAGSGRATTADIEDGIRVVRVRSTLGERFGPLQRLFAQVVISATYARALAAVHRRHPIDVVEFSNWGAGGFVHSIFRARPYVTRISTMGWQTRGFGPRTRRSRYAWVTDRWRDWTEAFPIHRSDLVLTHSAEHAYVASRRLHLDVPPEVRPLGTCESEPGRPDAAAPLPEPRQDLLFVGALGQRKGFDVLVDGFARACHGLPRATRLLVAGSDAPDDSERGSYSESILRLVPDGVRSRIDVLGWVSDAELVDLYRRCAALVVPSRYESFGLPCIEAMQHGRAVIATRVGGIPEVVSDGIEGLLVPPGDVNGLANAMTRVVNDLSLRRSLERSARARYEREFTAAAFATRAEADYRRAIQMRRNRSAVITRSLA